ncbi:heme utilization cystosolic carrier protein HutX [Hyphomicrobium sp.]|jgi:putative heme utilization carrier protein HutX|uniref:heme utilization cystosolic carrier protein HutX n=1 Tax=Hyphomicrobium sp. TaxID=82 RepID=UPI002BF38044|nr:heme utilization cystosolic carrier protein HutX [Hyphomicrobium sp.]HVZ03819.1 heme utilization cystosolic carrier protein HutX [Hyphomicrobium sp.]
MTLSVVGNASCDNNAEAAVRAALRDNPDGVLEAIADKHSVPYRTVLDCLPSENSSVAPTEAFDRIWQDLTDWGPIVFIVHTADGVFETACTIPPGTHARGYFNIHGDSPLGGHLKIDRCAAIYFVDRPFFKRRSCSVQFINGDGQAMFKIFVGRDEDKNLKPEQVARFEKLRAETAVARDH